MGNEERSADRLAPAEGVGTPPAPALTIAICTRNRADLLRDAVQSALPPRRDSSSVEVLVIDNGSTDATPAVLAELQAAHPELRALREPRAGLSVARNRALAEARGDVIAFIDDDAVLPPEYADILQRFWKEKRPACAGGPIKNEYRGAPPPGWGPEHDRMASAYDLGEKAQCLAFGQYPQGGNIAYDRSLARAAGGFDEYLGVRPEGPWAAEETELAAWLSRHGYPVWYCPELRVIHHPTRAESSEAWLRRMAWYRGRSHVYTLRAYHGRLKWRTFLRLFAEDVFRLFPWNRLDKRITLAMAWGKLFEATRLLLRGELRCPRPPLPPAPSGAKSSPSDS